MNYETFCNILNEHIFEGEKKDLMKKIAEYPERFIGLFRPTKPGAKILQHLLQSHEIRMGDALEEIIGVIIHDIGFENLPKSIKNDEGEQLSLDQYFKDDNKFYFVEQKVRDDHDSTKKRGQISNFEAKLEILHGKHGQRLTGLMHFIDPDLSKNKNYYIQELRRLENFYGVDVHLFYGKELFEYFEHPEIWNDILNWLESWKNNLPELPDINFDTTPNDSFEKIKALELRYWRKITENEKLWDEGIVKAIFRTGQTLRLLESYFETQTSTPYRVLSNLLQERLSQYY